MRIKTFLLMILSLWMTVQLGCQSGGNAPGGGSIPAITGAVKGASSLTAQPLSVQPQAVSGALLNSQTCSICGSSSAYSYVFYIASIFVMQGALADANTCTIAAVDDANAIPGLTSGEYKYTSSSGVITKLKITKEKGAITSYEMFTCMNGTQVQYTSGTNAEGVATFKFRSSNGSNFVKMDGTGTVNGTTWTSKNLVVSMNISGAKHQYTITQGSSYLDISGAADNATTDTLDGTDYRMVSRVQLLGTKVKTYAIGDGSSRSAAGTNPATNINWNGDTGTHGAGPTTYDSVVASATLPTIPLSGVVSAFTSDETWNCNTTSTPIDLMTLAASNAGLQKTVMKCMEDLQ